jgi:hypothetical protein
LQNITSPLETIPEEVSPDNIVKDIVHKLNSEHQDSVLEKTPSPASGEKSKVDDSKISEDEGPILSQAEPERTSDNC